MQNFLWIIAVGCIGAYVAKKRKLNPFFWFAICFMLGFTALLGLIFFPFFLKKWKKKTPPVIVLPQPTFSAESIWYYLDTEDKQTGPMSFLKLQQNKQEGTISEDTYVWHETFSQWKCWKDVFPKEKE